MYTCTYNNSKGIFSDYVWYKIQVHIMIFISDLILIVIVKSEYINCIIYSINCSQYMALGKNLKHEPSIINTPSYVKVHNTDIIFVIFQWKHIVAPYSLGSYFTLSLRNQNYKISSLTRTQDHGLGFSVCFIAYTFHCLIGSLVHLFNIYFL